MTKHTKMTDEELWRLVDASNALVSILEITNGLSREQIMDILTVFGSFTSKEAIAIVENLRLNGLITCFEVFRVSRD